VSEYSRQRVIWASGHAAGVDVELYLAAGYSDKVNLTPVAGRVVLPAGTFDSAKILLRSEWLGLFYLGKC